LDLKKIEFVLLTSDYLSEKTVTVRIEDSVIVRELFKEINSFKNKSIEPIKPFKGSILLVFGYYDGDKSQVYLSKYSTGIIIKENNTLLITNYKGTFKSDSFTNRVIKLFLDSKNSNSDSLFIEKA
jgi:hypothetical protein